MAAEKRRLFALKKAEQAVLCFSNGDWGTGLPKARAALELLEGVKDVRPEDTSLLCGGVCLALAAGGCTGEALKFFSEHALEIADEHIKEHLLQLWATDSNAPAPGDLVQLTGAGGAQLVGVVLGPSAVIGCWHVRVTGSASEATAAAGPGEAQLPVPEAAEVAGEELEVSESDMTLLTLRLSEEQRRHWRRLLAESPELFGQRMSSDNEARWQRLFGAAARRQTPGNATGIGAGACAAAEDMGLPLEQSFVATLHGLLRECLEHGGEKASLLVDVLGCRPALELEAPEAALAALLGVLPSSLTQLTVRMCGPEVGCEDRRSSQELEGGRVLTLEVRQGLYHETLPEAEADLVVAMNAGIGVPQYTAMWGPTLDLLERRKRPGLFALTSYTPGELLREERLLRARWAATVSLTDTPELAEALAELAPGPQPWTLPRPVRAQRTADSGEVQLQRGDVLQPVAARSGKAPEAVRVLQRDRLVYVGPNQTPGRSRNYGKLLLRVGPGGDLSHSS